MAWSRFLQAHVSSHEKQASLQVRELFASRINAIESDAEALI
jgi:hypothetical protein